MFSQDSHLHGRVEKWVRKKIMTTLKIMHIAIYWMVSCKSGQPFRLPSDGAGPVMELSCSLYKGAPYLFNAVNAKALFETVGDDAYDSPYFVAFRVKKAK